MNYGEQKYGEMYSQAREKTELNYQSVANFKYVSNRKEISRWRENLSWSHHLEVAAIELPEQKHWLDKAEKGNGNGPWKVKDLRRASKESKPSEYPPCPSRRLVER